MSDHRPAGFASVGAERFVESLEELRRLTETAVHRVIELPATSPAGSVVRLRIAGRTNDGDPFENEIWAAVFVRDGLIERIEVFPEDARTEAVACLTATSGLGHALAPTTASRFIEQWGAAIRAADVAELARLSSPDLIIEDRRPITGVPIEGPEAVASGWVVAEEFFGREVAWEIVATRGDRLGLAHVRWTSTDAEVSVLSFGEVDAEGRLPPGRHVRCRGRGQRRTPSSTPPRSLSGSRTSSSCLTRITETI